MKAKPPKITNIVCHLDARYGGMSAAVPALSRASAVSQRHSIALAAICGLDEVIEEGIADGVEIQRFPLGRIRGLADLRLYSALRSTVETSDVVHIHGIWQESSSVASALARESGIPVVVSAHGMLERWAIGNKRWKKALYFNLVEKKNLRSSACLRALTRAEVGDYRRHGLTNPVAVIPNGITPPGIVNRELFWEAYPKLRSRRLVLFLSRIHYKKGLEPLCRAWANIAQRFPDACLVLAGPDFENTRASIELLVSELEIGESVIFTGMLSGELKWAALAAADLFVLPSFSEGFSVAILEAMAMGRPVLISHQCNFDEAGEAGCGVLIEPVAGEIESALDSLLRMPQATLDEMGARGRSLVASQYNWSIVGQQMADVYDWMLGGREPTSVEICA
jgi:glycosyltransferase involved in cell wall biosynthesis